MENEKLHPDAIASYDRLKRDFARLCVLLDARRDGDEAGVMVGPVEDAHVETLEALFDRLHKHLQSLEFYTAPGPSRNDPHEELEGHLYLWGSSLERRVFTGKGSDILPLLGELDNEKA